MGGTTSGAAYAGFFFFPGATPAETGETKMLKINGEEKDAAGQTVAAYLASAGYDAARVVVELNEAIVPKGRYAETTLRDGDQVEIVCFMGGG